MNAFRIPGLLVIVGLLIGGLVLDQTREPPEVIERAIGLPGTAVAQMKRSRRRGCAQRQPPARTTAPTPR